jgi:hypothetical protein
MGRPVKGDSYRVAELCFPRGITRQRISRYGSHEPLVATALELVDE